MTALAGRFGGIAVMRPRDGEVLALAGVAYSAPQPPGSTFKIVTLAGLLDAGVVKRSAKFPIETKTSLEGVELENANGEACGGSLRASFAESCNSVFAPLGAKLGAERLVATAEKFGFNEEPGLPGAARSTIPAAAEVGDDLAVGSTAIGQGKVLATPLLMADVASAIAQDGRRPKPTLLKGGGRRRRPRHHARDRAVHRPRDALRRHRRHRHRRRRARREGGGQDRHGRAALDRQRGPDPRRPDPAAAGGGPHGHRRVVHRLRAAQATRRSRSACCSSVRAPAAPPRRRRPRRSSRPR